jgi:hypothetical protein
VPDDGRLHRQAADDLVEVIRDLPDGLVRHDLGMRVRLADGFGVVGPPRRERRVAGLLERRGPAVPAAREQPQAVHEHDGSQTCLVRPRDLLHFVFGDGCRGWQQGRHHDIEVVFGPALGLRSMMAAAGRRLSLRQGRLSSVQS